MANDPGRDLIRIRGARQNNLKGFDLDLPARRLIVITGLSGSGKSSLAFDTLYAEGQRRYIETFSPYARQFFDRMDKPRVDAIEGIPPAIALEQRNSVRTTRSTVGTMTEICDHMKVLWPRLARLHCLNCGEPVRKEAPGEIWDALRPGAHAGSATEPARNPPARADALITFTLPLSGKLSLGEQLDLIGRQGFQRILAGSEVLRLEDARARLDPDTTAVTIVQDRVRMTPENRARFVEACEQAYHFGHGRLAVVSADADRPGHWTDRRPFSRHLHCPRCDLEYQEPRPALFSFNHPMGACATCKGFGRIIAIDYNLAIPDRSKTLAEGAVKPWQTETGAECQADMVRFAKRAGVPLNVPFRDLPEHQQRWVIDGDPDYGEGNEWPHAWYGIKGYFRWLESKAYKMHVRVLLSRYRAYRTCPDCDGRRLNPDALLWRLPAGPDAGGPSLTLADFYALTAGDALGVIDRMAELHPGPPHDPFCLALAEVRARLSYLVEAGVGYLTLDRATRTLSGGETQRVNLTSCLGSSLVNTLFVLDEPSVGLHPRDTEKLVRVLERLRDLGNTVVVVEHEAAVMRAADHIIDLGPGHGESGGNVVAQGSFKEILRHPASLTGAYLSSRRSIPIPARRPVDPALAGPRADVAPRLADAAAPYRAAAAARAPALHLRGITRHNLRGLDVSIPLGRMVCLSGVSGSGKTTLAGELLRLLHERLGTTGRSAMFGVRESENEETPEPDADHENAGGGGRLEGAEHLGAVLLVDQSPIGRTPRSNPAVYTGAFDPIRELFAQSPQARAADLPAGAFSFNSRAGQCEQCRGAGFERIEMQFLSDVYIRCPACEGRRYRPHILEIRIPVPEGVTLPMIDLADTSAHHAGLSIADVLDLPVDDAIPLLEAMDSAHARLAARRLRVIQEVGLGYLRLGQPINTLSGGESQRLKLAGHLVEAFATSAPAGHPARNATARKPSLLIFDEPTTGLHFEDVRILLEAFQRVVDAGDSVLIIEHNVELLKCADWIIDLGPEAGERGGRIVVAGTPEDVADCGQSHTGRALRAVLTRRPARPSSARAARPARR